MTAAPFRGKMLLVGQLDPSKYGYLGIAVLKGILSDVCPFKRILFGNFVPGQPRPKGLWSYWEGSSSFQYDKRSWEGGRVHARSRYYLDRGTTFTEIGIANSSILNMLAEHPYPKMSVEKPWPNFLIPYFRRGKLLELNSIVSYGILYY